MFEFRKYHPADLPRCLTLLQVGHSHSFTLERFRWLHEMAPGGPSEIAVCTSGKQIIGLYSVIRKTVRLGGQVFQGGRDVNPVVHPDFRGQGIFSQLLNCGLTTFENLDFCFNFANALSAPGFRKAGWKDVGTLEDRIFQLGYESVLSRQFIAWLATGARRRRGSVDDARETTQQEAFRLLAEALEHRLPWSDTERLSVERSTAYLRWRYVNNPLDRKNRWFVRGPACHPTGLAVCSFEPQRNALFVLDLFGFDSVPRLRDWLGCWARTFPRSWIGIWSSIPSEVYDGFRASPLQGGKGSTFLVRSFPGRALPERLMRPDGWYITRGDLEVS